MTYRDLRNTLIFFSASLLLVGCGESQSTGAGKPGEAQASAVTAMQKLPDLGGWAGAGSPVAATALDLKVAKNGVDPAQRKKARPKKTLAEKIAEMPPNTGMLLPASKVIALDEDQSKGPAPRSYSGRMVYSKERQTALYLGAGHNTHRRNDVWEYHLASNTWQQLFPSDGGSHKPLLSLYYKVLSKTKQKAIEEQGYSAEQETVLANAKAWWQNNARLQNGRITTRQGGPLLPFHTWDGVVFDDSVGKLLWAVGASWLNSAKAHALLTGQSQSVVESKLLPNLSSMWSFDPATQQYEQLQFNGTKPQLRGMGSSLVYLPDQQKTLYYAAASNVVPGEYSMFLFDAKNNGWQQLKPNGGVPIRELAIKRKAAPRAEKQMAYSAQHQLVLAVLRSDTFLYDLRTNRWERLASDARISGHDARSVLVFDEAAGVFLLFNPNNKEVPLAEFLPTERRWNVLKPEGDAPVVRGYHQMGYYDTTFKRLVVRRGHGQVWVYRR